MLYIIFSIVSLTSHVKILSSNSVPGNVHKLDKTYIFAFIKFWSIDRVVDVNKKWIKMHVSLHVHIIDINHDPNEIQTH